MKSSVKLLAAAVPVVVAALAAALVYIYPRRMVADPFSVVPSRGMAFCARVKGLGELWRELSETTFAVRAREGDIHPIREMKERGDDFADEWVDADLDIVPIAFGDDVVAALYAGDGDGPRVAAWSRIGSRVRAFHLFERVRDTILFWREPVLEMKRVGGITVASYMDPRTRRPRASYLLVGDLGIATPGSGDEFWQEIDALLSERAGAAGAAKATLVDVPRPRPASASGAFEADAPRLERLFFSWMKRRQGGEGLDARLSSLLARAGTIRGSFTLGKKTTIVAEMEGDVWKPGRRPDAAPPDPLRKLLGSGGFAYAEVSLDGRRLAGRAIEAGKSRSAELVFAGKRRRSVFPAEHFSLDWVGDDFSLLLYAGEGGIVHAAVSAGVRDPATAAERLRRFAGLADGARLLLVDGRGNILTGTKRLDIGSCRPEGGECYRIGLDRGWARFIAPVCTLRGDRLYVSTSLTLIEKAFAAGPPAGRAAGERPPLTIVIRGSEAFDAAESMRRILAFAGLFLKRPEERERMARVLDILGYGEWLAPLRELEVTGSERGEKAVVNLEAEFADVSPAR